MLKFLLNQELLSFVIVVTSRRTKQNGFVTAYSGSYYPSGVLASEGLYELGLETGVWRDFHANGFLAAEGEYKLGQKFGVWKFWDSEGCLESESTEE